MKIKVIAIAPCYIGGKMIHPDLGKASEFTIDCVSKFSDRGMQLHQSTPEEVVTLVENYLKAKVDATKKYRKEIKKDASYEYEHPEIPDQEGLVIEPKSESEGPSLDDRLVDAMNSLDHDDDDSWTKDGKPLMSKLEEILGVDSSELSRADVDAVDAGFIRLEKDEDEDEDDSEDDSEEI